MVELGLAGQRWDEGRRSGWLNEPNYRRCGLFLWSAGYQGIVAFHKVGCILMFLAGRPS